MGGNEESAMNEPAKEKADKLPIYQAVLSYFPRAIQEVCRISQYGVEKHNAPFNAPTFPNPEYPVEGFVDAIARHLLKRAMYGEINKEDGDTYHLAAVIWSGLAALEKILREKERIENEYR